MNKVFCAKMNKQEEIDNRTFTADKEAWLNGVDVDDFAFIKPVGQGIIELWRATEWITKKNIRILKFKLVSHFDQEIEISKQFIALKLFKLDVNLLNRILKPTCVCFVELKLVDDSLLKMIENDLNIRNYIKNEKNYRNILVCDSITDVKKESQDIQIYKENGVYKLYESNFLDEDTLIDKFNGSNYLKGKYAGSTKGKLYKIIEKGEKVITRSTATLASFYDLFVSNNDTTQNIRKEFIEWCKKNGVQSAFKQYESGLRKIEKEHDVNVDEEYKKNGCQDILNQIKNDPEVIKSKRNSKGNQRNWDSYLNKYIEFKNSISDTIPAKIICPKDHQNNNINKEMFQFLKLNTIFYGVPGCGKSYYVKELLKKNDGSDLAEKYYKRILFHPEYTYSDFIGQVMPESKSDKIEYKFQAGPFVEILKDAINDKEGQYFLIIEEINRGNAPAIFGDIFQLLDRNDDGESEYQIYNKDISQWLKDNDTNISKVYIPSNLTILATMNTSDQNVFTLDTAFKRRWRMSRIKNNFDQNDEILNTLIKVGNIEFTWKTFAKALNNDIIKNCNDGTIAEDKMLGTHFVKKYELDNIQIFAEKILMYLWSDVVKYNKEQLFKSDIETLDVLIDKFIKGDNVFNCCEKLDALYENANKEKVDET